jgi:hypothetical protein
MKNFKSPLLFSFLVFSLFVPALLQAQKDSDFQNCSAAFLNGKMIVDEYSPEGKCVVSSKAKGKLSLHPVELSNDHPPIPGEKIKFKVAIRGGSTRTFMMLSEKTWKEIDIEDVLKECQKGDAIVLLTLERQWAVPHSEILVTD